MSEVKWTKEQLQAINSKGSNMLVAAAAGSGKTAVLVERIIHKIIEEEIDITNLLVVTFTNAAASEMRQKILDAIYQYIEENPDDQRMQKQIVLMSKASICTIHAFCLEVIKNHFYDIGISPNVRIGEQTEIMLLKQEVLEDLFEEKYEQEEKEFLRLVNTYTTYLKDDPLKEIIFKIDRTISSNPFPEEWLEQKVEEFSLQESSDFAKTKWGKILLYNLKEEISICLKELEVVKQELDHFEELEKFSRTILTDMQKLEELEVNLDSWDKAYELANNLKWDTWPRDSKITLEQKEIAKEKRDEIKKRLNKTKDKILLYDSKQAFKDMKEMSEVLMELKKLVLEFKQRFAKKKQEKNMIDFNDIEHFALKLLVSQDEEGNKVPTKIAEEYKEKYTEIAIDEYQDSNLVQEYILNTISRGNNLFMVGDVKQSIYQFRQARPELFIEKYETYQLQEEKEEKDSLKIQLFKNFRSKENVLKITNLIFENIMTKELGDITYDEKEYLNLGASYPKLEKEENKIELDVIDLKKQEITEEKVEEVEDQEIVEDIVVEAKFVAKRIENLIKQKYQVYDKKKREYRDITYRDIVILLRSTSNSAPIYEKELNKLEIPVFSDTNKQYLDTIEIQTILSLLKIIDNPMQDIPFVSVLRSIIGGFTDNELISMKVSGGKKSYFYETFTQAMTDEALNQDLRKRMQNFLQNLDDWRKENEYMPLDEFIWKLYLDTGYYHYVGFMPNGTLRQANLKLLFEKAKEYEKASFKGLFYFIHFIDQLKLGSGDMDSAKIIGENENIVRIMSIHKSKGLEFPVVILASTGKKFNLKDLNDSILLHQDLGLGVMYIDPERKIQYPTLTKLAISQKVMTETLSEEMRVLYVALTRAKEKLIITGSSKDFAKSMTKKEETIKLYKNQKIDPSVLKRYSSYLDWILLVYLKEKEKTESFLELFTYTREEILSDKEEKEQAVDNWMEEIEKYKDRIEDSLIKKLQWVYPEKEAIYIPTKTSVSKIKQMEEEIPYIPAIEEKQYKKERRVPQFLKQEIGVTSARRGSMVHLCMQHLNEKEEYTLEKIQHLIQMLVQKEFITQKEAQAIPCNMLLEYTKSDFFQTLKEAKQIKKEAPFYIHMDARELYQKETKEKVLVQGVIDLYYITKEEHMILVDYKTDYVKEERELVNKYTKQLEIYKRALEEAENRKVDEVWIYSLYLQRPIQIDF